MVKTRYTEIAVEPFIAHYQEERPVLWAEKFGNRGPLFVEIGFGMGEFLLRQAQGHPDWNFVGIEQDWKRIKKTLRKIDLQEKIQRHRNIRILLSDASVALGRLFHQSTIDGIFCLFPCPWPKKGHEKHRLFSRDFLRLLNNRLKPDGEIQIVTDALRYHEWILENSQDTGFHVSVASTPARFDTKYERKWLAAGQKFFHEISLKKKDHVFVPLEEDEELRVYFAQEFDPQRFEFNDAHGPVSIVCKEFLYDSLRKKAMVHLVVAEPKITQHLWVIIIMSKQGWCIAKAEGQTVLPTPGMAEAVRCVYEEVKRTASQH